jgi:hypothetical protein
MRAHRCPKVWRDKTPLQRHMAIREREARREILIQEATNHRPVTRSQQKKMQTKEVSASSVAEEESWTALEWVEAATRAVQEAIAREAMEEMPPGPKTLLPTPPKVPTQVPAPPAGI